MPTARQNPFVDFAAVARPRIEAALAAALELPDRPDERGRHCPAVLGEALRYCLLAPGKRLRPLVVLMAAEACGRPWEAALPAACAVEMVHTYSLIHDDLPAMDDDDLRRGRPTCHRVYGEALAILTGDALLALAFEVLARDVRPAAAAARACQVLAQAAGAAALVGGQTDDLAAEGKIAAVGWAMPTKTAACDERIPNAEHQTLNVEDRTANVEPRTANSENRTWNVEQRTSSEDRAAAEMAIDGNDGNGDDDDAAARRLWGIHSRKTAAMFAASATLGGVCAGAAEATLAALERYGYCLGLAFQIQDDLLDVAGQEQSLGKRVGKDSSRGKLTYPGLLGVDESHRRARALIDDACAALAPLGNSSSALAALASYAVERDR